MHIINALAMIFIYVRILIISGFHHGLLFDALFIFSDCEYGMYTYVCCALIKYPMKYT